MAKYKYYLYGASVQGIQQFIFNSNKIREIAGASELVKAICDDLFEQVAGTEANIIGAAGEIRHIFGSADEEVCRKVVREFPKLVMQEAPGITISQAVIGYDEWSGSLTRQLDDQLKVQRNKPVLNLNYGLMGMKRMNDTGLPISGKNRKGEYSDASTIKKEEGSSLLELVETSFGMQVKSAEVAFDVEDITNHNDWVAIIHADGNGVGQVVREVAKDKETYRAFSKTLGKVTQEAAQKAYQQVAQRPDFLGRSGRIPIRPVILGGDDLTVIIRGDLAIEYVATYLEAFEQLSEEQLGAKKLLGSQHKRLTACAGIAFTKSSYPFYYGYNLAESLCGVAKKIAKHPPFVQPDKGELAPSCLMFHKVQDGYVMDYDDIISRELLPQPTHSFQYGPYFLNKESALLSSDGRYFTIEELIDFGEQLNRMDPGVKSGLRQWLSLINKDEEQAEQRLERLLSIQGGVAKTFIEKMVGRPPYQSLREGKDKEGKEVRRKHHFAYDLLAYYTIMNQGK
ncbi:hypothetical protein [uncultured Porphyromonas sp.]|uniref:Cas10/Cmr2 second palm domain-containing protein n=1 Tax=uncultured Porphyromonas sp. TaxID=159274 RepID=UPI00259BBB20|nr:hypothetical protein [uncultured Porphyromonas sp.]